MWAIIRRVLAGIGLVVALVGIGIFVAAIVGTWQLKAETNRKTEEFAAQAHTAVNAADTTVQFVQRVLDEAKGDLRVARERTQSAPRERVNPFLQLTARRASENLAGSVERANTAVITASE